MDFGKTKKCTVCEQEKELTEFYKRGDNSDLEMSVCKDCFKEGTNESRRKRGKPRKTELIRLFGGKCAHCGGEFHPEVYDFHHVDPSTKSFSIGGRGLLKPFDLILEEAKKCIMLCSNCHRTLHAQERAQYYESK